MAFTHSNWIFDHEIYDEPRVERLEICLE